MQHFAARQIGHEARIAFAEADERLALLRHMLDREPPTATIAPKLRGERLQPALRLDLADAREVLRQHALLGLDLRARIKVLQGAAAAHAVVDAARCYPLRRR